MLLFGNILNCPPARRGRYLALAPPQTRARHGRRPQSVLPHSLPARCRLCPRVAASRPRNQPYFEDLRSRLFRQAGRMVLYCRVSAMIGAHISPAAVNGGGGGAAVLP